MAEAKKKQPEAAARPLILEIAEAKEETVAAINGIIKRHNLPAYFMENIVGDIYRQIAAGAQQELATLKAAEQAKTAQQGQNKEE